MYYDTICIHVCIKCEVNTCLFGYVCACVCVFNVCRHVCAKVRMSRQRTTYECGSFLLRRASGINSYIQNICQALWSWVIWVLGGIDSCLFGGSIISFVRQHFLIEQCWLANVLQASTCPHLHWECRLMSFCFRSRYFINRAISPSLQTFLFVINENMCLWEEIKWKMQVQWLSYSVRVARNRFFNSIISNLVAFRVMDTQGVSWWVRETKYHFIASLSIAGISTPTNCLPLKFSI